MAEEKVKKTAVKTDAVAKKPAVKKPAVKKETETPVAEKATKKTTKKAEVVEATPVVTEKPVKKPVAKKAVVDDSVVVPEVKDEKKPAAKAKAEVKAEVKAPAEKVEKVTNRILKKYRDEIIPLMMKEFNYSSVMAVPRLDKIVINMGLGEAAGNSKVIEDASRDLSAITGQHPIPTISKKSIAAFKLRDGIAIGLKVTLRGEKMYEFLDKLMSISLPRVRDFRGVSKNSFDGHGNYSIGIKEQLIFPEIKYENITKIRGMDITIVTTASSDKEASTLLQNLGMPFSK